MEEETDGEEINDRKKVLEWRMIKTDEKIRKVWKFRFLDRWQ